MTFCVTCKRVRFSSASAKVTLAAATRRSGLFFSASVNISSSFDLFDCVLSFAGGRAPGCPGGAPGARGRATGGRAAGCPGCAGKDCPTPILALANTVATASELTTSLRMIVLLLSGVLDRHEQPIVVRRDGQVLFRSVVERVGVTAQRRLRIIFLLHVGIGGLPVQFAALVVAVEGVPFLHECHLARQPAAQARVF